MGGFDNLVRGVLSMLSFSTTILAVMTDQFEVEFRTDLGCPAPVALPTN
jgi:hypothetical protein